MSNERAPHMPAKGRLTWHISRLRLAAAGDVWLATASKGNRVAIIPLPQLDDPSREEAWLEQIEARCEAGAFDPTVYGYPEPLP